MKTYPTPHKDKLLALLDNDKLPYENDVLSLGYF